jgi:hypothetical protein
VHGLPPLDLGIFGVAPDAGQIRDDPQLRTPRKPGSSVLADRAGRGATEMSTGQGLDLLLGINRCATRFLHQAGLVREHKKQRPPSGEQDLRPVDGESHIVIQQRTR